MNPHTRRPAESFRTARWLILLFALLPAGAFSAGAATVVLHLRNGDRISGELVRENDERLVVKSSSAGKVSVPKSEIVGRESPDAPAPGPTPTPTPATAPSAATTTPSPAPTHATVVPAPVPPPPPPTLSLLGVPTGWISPFLTNWHGNLGLGMNLGFGTTDRQSFYVNANAVHSWERLVNNISYNAAYGFVNQTEAANRMDGILKTDLFVDHRKKLYTYNQFLGGYDRIRGIDQRIEEGVGMGYRLLERTRLVLNGEFGGQYQFFNYVSQPDHEVWSVRLGENLTWKPNERLSLTQRLQFLPNVSDVSEYRARFELIAACPLLKRLTISMNLVDEYESRPPLGADNNDLQVTTNVNITF